MATIPTDNISHGGATMNWKVPYVRFKHPGTGLYVTMATEDIVADLTTYGGKTLQEHINELSTGTTPVEQKTRTNYKKSGETYLNTSAQDYVVNGGTIDYDYADNYSGIFAKA